MSGEVEAQRLDRSLRLHDSIEGLSSAGHGVLVMTGSWHFAGWTRGSPGKSDRWVRMLVATLYVVYLPTWVDDDEVVHFRPDHYGRESVLSAHFPAR